MEAPDADLLVQRACVGDRASLSRLISGIEDGDVSLITRLPAEAPPPYHIVGVTGPPGAGKSTLIGAMANGLREGGLRVAVLAVDPSSPLSGGALLGDRLRMGDAANDEGIYIRSMASRGYPGGLSLAVPQAAAMVSAAGYEIVLVETVGVGQAEIDVVRHTDTTVLVTTAGSGDEVQATKSGVVEIADVVVVNKADLGGASLVAHDIAEVIDVSSREAAWKTPVLEVTAKTGAGVREVLDAVDRHRSSSCASGELQRRRDTARRRAMQSAVAARLTAEVTRLMDGAEDEDAVQDYLSGACSLTEMLALIERRSPTIAPTESR